jgi:predicted N-acyltransferase
MNVPLAIVALPGLRPLIGLLEKVLPALFRPRTLFVGSPCADEGTVGILPGVDRRRALSCLQAALELEMRQRRAAMLVWKDFPPAYDDDLKWLAAQRRMFRMVSYPNAVVTFPTSRKEDYFAMLKSSRRNKLKKKIRLSKERVDVKIEVIQGPDDRALDEIFSLFWQTYERSATKFETLNRKFFALIAAKPVAHFVVLREQRSGEMIAFMLCFDLGGRVINKFIGIDYARPRAYFLYFRLWDAAVDWALSRGAASIQSGQTAYEAKIEIGHALVALVNYGLHRNPLIHRIYSAVAERIRWQMLDHDLADFLKAHPEADPEQQPR